MCCPMQGRDTSWSGVSPGMGDVLEWGVSWIEVCHGGVCVMEGGGHGGACHGVGRGRIACPAPAGEKHSAYIEDTGRLPREESQKGQLLYTAWALESSLQQ